MDDVEDGVSFGGAFVTFPLSFGVLSLLFWRGVNLDSSLSSLPWGVGIGGVFGLVWGVDLGGVSGGWSPFCLGGSPSAGSKGFINPLECAVE